MTQSPLVTTMWRISHVELHHKTSQSTRGTLASHSESCLNTKFEQNLLDHFLVMIVVKKIGCQSAIFANEVKWTDMQMSAIAVVCYTCPSSCIKWENKIAASWPYWSISCNKPINQYTNSRYNVLCLYQVWTRSINPCLSCSWKYVKKINGRQSAIFVRLT